MKKSKQKGITLLEVIVVIAIIGILLGPIFDTMMTNMRLSREANERTNAKDVALLVQEYIYNQVKWADKVEYSDAPTSMGQSIYIDATKGLVHKKDENENIIYSKKAMDNVDVSIAFKKLSTTQDTLTRMQITVGKIENGISKVLYTTNTSIKSINIFSGSVPDTTGKVINFQISE